MTEHVAALGRGAHVIDGQQAARFLLRAQFSARPQDIAALQSTGYHAWLDAQFADAGRRAEAAAALVELVEGEKFQRARRRVRDALAADGISGEIDELVEKLLDGADAG